MKVKNEVKESKLYTLYLLCRTLTFEKCTKRSASRTIHGESLATAKLHEADSTRYMLTISVKKVFSPHDCNINGESMSKLCFNTRRQKKIFFASSLSISELMQPVASHAVVFRGIVLPPPHKEDEEGIFPLSKYGSDLICWIAKWGQWTYEKRKVEFSCLSYLLS